MFILVRIFSHVRSGALSLSLVLVFSCARALYCVLFGRYPPISGLKNAHPQDKCVALIHALDDRETQLLQVMRKSVSDTKKQHTERSRAFWER